MVSVPVLVKRNISDLNNVASVGGVGQRCAGTTFLTTFIDNDALVLSKVYGTADNAGASSQFIIKGVIARGENLRGSWLHRYIGESARVLAGQPDINNTFTAVLNSQASNLLHGTC